MRRVRKWMLWPARLLVYSLCAWLGLWVIFPAAGGGVLGMVLAAPTAALAIGLDIFLSSKVLGNSGEAEAVRRLVVVDKILGGQLEEKSRLPKNPSRLPPGSENSPEEKVQLPEGSSSSKTSPPSER